MQRTRIFFIVFLFCVFCIGISVIAEEITLTTYYPAPYGAYQQLDIFGGDIYLNDTVDGTRTIGTRDVSGMGGNIVNLALSANIIDENTKGAILIPNNNLGIGTEEEGPNAKLSLGHDTAPQKLLLLDTTYRYGFGVMDGEFRQFFPDNGTDHLSIGTNSIDGEHTWTEKLRITKEGNVGIGTTEPTAKLHVNGEVKAVSYSINDTAGVDSIFRTGNIWIRVTKGIITYVGADRPQQL